MRDKSTALSYIEKTLEIEQKSLSSNHPSLSMTHSNMAKVLEDLHRYREAMDHAKRAVHIAIDAFGSEHSTVKCIRNQIHRLQRKL